jgi:hypothetical protein
MHTSNPLAAARPVVTSILTNQLVRRLLLSILITGFDGSVLVTAGKEVLDVAPEAPLMSIAFLILGLLLLVTLARIWFLTFSEPSPQPADQSQPEPS